jgi:hypothetical protein
VRGGLHPVELPAPPRNERRAPGKGKLRRPAVSGEAAGAADSAIDKAAS